MLQRRMVIGESFEYRHPETDEFIARLTVIEIRHGSEVVLGIEAADGLFIEIDPAEESDSVARPDS